MFDSVEALKNGSEKQQAAYRAIQSLNILVELQKYSPIICGTIPLGVDTDESDIDVILEVRDLHSYMEEISHYYRDMKGFRIKETIIRTNKVVKANFHYEGFEFELFGQAQPVIEQNAYKHMIIESKLLQQNPGLKERIIKLKQQGVKTEPAFCQVLGIDGQDPYAELISYGKSIMGD